MSGNQIISERAQCLLKALVGRYIRDGQPVGSRTLARDAGLDLSPATVRNVMADLEDLQLVTSPHVSAGRIPTMLGYRFFVDSLLTIESLDSAEVQRLKKQLDPDKNTQGLLEAAFYPAVRGHAPGPCGYAATARADHFAPGRIFALVR